MTDGTCWPQPHQEDFSKQERWSTSGIRAKGEEGVGWGGVRQVVQVPGLHIASSVGAKVVEGRARISSTDLKSVGGLEGWRWWSLRKKAH